MNIKIIEIKDEMSYFPAKTPTKVSLEINGLKFVLMCGYGCDIASVGFPFDEIREKNILVNGKAMINALKKFQDNLSEIEHAIHWHLRSSLTVRSHESPEQFIEFCNKEALNPYLTKEGKTNIKRMINIMKKRIREDKFHSLQRKKFIKIRKKNITQLLESSNYACKECGARENLTVDHIIPITRGGKNKLSNFQILCRSCNSSKWNNLPEEWKQKKNSFLPNKGESL